jgi:dTDP-4-amino-4,6-dideoxygalactose transaminase
MTTIATITDTLAIDGGTPVRRAPWPTYDKGDTLIGREEEEAAVRALRSQLLFRYDGRDRCDTEVGRFEAALEKHFGARHALAVSSGTAAITVGLLAAGVRPGDRIACPAFTFPATPSAVLLAGAVPVLVGVDKDLNLDVDDLASKLESCRGVVVVHMRGFASDIERVVELAHPLDIPVIEDAVPALGAQLRGRAVGTFGTAGAFSTQSDKSLNTGEGGFVLTDDDTVAARATVLAGAFEGRVRKHHDPPPVDDLDLPLFSFRMDEVRGAIAHAQLQKLPARLAAMQRNYEAVIEALAGIQGIRLRQPVAPGALLGEALLFRIPGASPVRAAWVAAALRAEGIDARAFGDPGSVNVRAFWHWRFLFPGRSAAQIAGQLPDSARYIAETIDVPLAPTLNASDIEDLADATSRVMSGAHSRTAP